MFMFKCGRLKLLQDWVGSTVVHDTMASQTTGNLIANSVVFHRVSEVTGGPMLSPPDP